MDKAFWLEKWQQGQIGFHQQEFNAYLTESWHLLGVPDASTVFVPLCGKSLDMLWLRGQGYHVLGVEISEQACLAFFQENGLEYACHREEPFAVYQAPGITIYCGDFFAFNAKHVSDVAVVYDRAAMVAMPEALRQRYVAHLRQILPAATPLFLVTMEYDQTQMHGPPFAVLQRDVERAYADAYAIQRVLRKDVLNENERFRERGVTALAEAVYVLRPK